MPVVNKALMGGLAALLGTGATALGYSMEKRVRASDMVAIPPEYPFRHKELFSAVDAASARRGYEVYRQVCAACHSLRYISFRHLVGFIHSTEEMKAIAAEAEVEDGPDDQGNMFTRKGKLTDFHKGPYPNKQAGMAANNGAYPPDLSKMAKARKYGVDYMYSLLTGYCDPPAGVKVTEGLNFNPYFQGGQLGMGQILHDDLIEYTDGTPATKSQMAKDVCTFLSWTAEPFINDRKKSAIKLFMAMIIAGIPVIYMRRTRHVPYLARKYTYIARKK